MWTWLVIAGVLLAVEMATGTFALLFAGLGALVAALLAYGLEDSRTLQIVVFAFSTVAGAVLAWRRVKQGRLPMMKDEDLGLEVTVVALPDAMGHLRVRFRGTEWTARLAQEGLSLEMGCMLVIQAKEGSLLVVGPRQKNS